MKKKNIVVWVERKLSKEEIKNFEKDNPGYKLSFKLRHPNFPFVILTVSLFLVAMKPILPYMLQLLQKALLP